MTYEVLARKWRPQRFEDVVGQEHVTKTLLNAVKTDRIAHAYLFVGSRGIGKTSIARIFAKTLNCQSTEGAKPCCKCDSCKEIADGNSLDVFEIDGASNNGVEQVRELRETVVYAPSRGPYKIYIIDEVHMLSSGAFNALLKTLEEPPPHVKFMFATTEPEKILPTIISRCQRFDLRRISTPKIVERLQLIADDDKINVTQDALLAIARGAEGGLRDAESAFDQLISFCGSDITEEDVLAVFGLVSRETLDNLGFAVLQGDIPTIITLISGLDDGGKDMQRLAMELMSYFRALLICLSIEDPSAALDLTDSQLTTLKSHASHTNTSKVLRVITFLEQAIDKMRYALSRRVLLEIALVRSGKAAVTVSLDEILGQLNELKKNMTSAGVADFSKKNSDSEDVKKKVIEEVKQPKEEVADDFVEPIDEKQESDDYVEMFPKISDGDALVRLQNNWSAIIENVGSSNPLIMSALHDSKPKEVNESTVLIEVDKEFKADIESLSQIRHRQAIEYALKDEIGSDIKVSFKVSEEPIEHNLGIFKEQPPSFDQQEMVVENNAEPIIAEQVNKKVRTPREWVRDVPEVKNVLEVFNGMITDIR
ncbi:MAG: DNA polymerase III subunit gamma/tau [Kiritimatiellae bacterium]|jgi:DNA polymerase-3 subunit gamma/tau|nr:DNA polymerase III subunit gamma/tau [Kiritimatiellia bacterium]